MAHDPTNEHPDGLRIPPELQALRTRIDEIDHQFLELLAERNRVVGEVAAVKRATSVPIRDPNRESLLLADRRDRASDSGLSPDVIESLFRLVLWASRNRQATLLAAVPPDLPSRTVAVIGAAGAMGSVMADLMESMGNDVLRVDRDTTLGVEEAAGRADVVIVSVNIRATPEVIRLAGPHVREDGLMADVTSTKRGPVDAMLDATNASVIGMHPLFGPGVHSLQGQRIVLTPARVGDNPDWRAWMRNILGAAGMVLLETTPDEHDRIMSVVQVLTHFSTEVVGRTMRQLDVSIEETMRYTSPIYHLELLMTARHFAQSADLYSAIEMSNPNTPEVVAAFRSAADELDTLLQRGDPAAFRDAFEEVTTFFGDYAEHALIESTHLIDRVVERS